jgi:integrase
VGRPPLPVGTWGEIYFKQFANSRWMARAQYRGADGVTRPTRRHGATKSAAKTALLEALAEMSGQDVGGDITKSTRLRELAEVWFAEQERLAAQGSKQMTSVDQYRDHYRRHIEQAMGELRMREMTVSRIHKFLVKLAERSSSTAVMCRKVLSGMLGYAVIHRALAANPVRDVGRIERKAKRSPRALEAAQILDWLAKLDADEYAREWDLPDLSRFLLGTGVRIGEALAVSWREVDLKVGAVNIEWHMVTIKRQGVVRVEHDKQHSTAELGLPSWCVEMLRDRKKKVGMAGLMNPVFPHPATGKYRDHREVGKAIRAVREEAGYPWLTSHQLGRKTVATVLDEGGATAREVADQLRHARPSMTQDVYMARQRVNTKQAAMLETMLDATS